MHNCSGQTSKDSFIKWTVKLKYDSVVLSVVLMSAEKAMLVASATMSRSLGPRDVQVI